MLKRWTSSLWLLGILFLCGCYHQYEDFFPCHDDGRPKPAIAFVPMRDISNSGLPWDVSEEIYSGVRESAKVSGHIFMIPEQEIAPVVEQFKGTDLFAQNLDFYKQFRGADFIVLSELVEHEEKPFHRKRDLSLSYNGEYLDPEDAAILEMKVLLKVVDIREEGHPRLHLQEVVDTCYVIPSSDRRRAENYREARWGTRKYENSAMKQAHNTLIRDVKSRLEQISNKAPT